MSSGRVLVPILFVGLLAAPFLFRSDVRPPAAEGRRLIIVTPHNEQIRHEFRLGFEAWHLRTYGETVQVVWSNPGGTSEIRKMLVADYTASLRDGRPLGGNADLVFGGGEFEHSQLKAGVSVVVDDETRRTSITAPVSFEPEEIEEFYGGRETIGSNRLFDEEGYWYGTALSGFGIVFNRDLLTQLGVPEPVFWRDLCDSRLRGWVALGNPGQSGSIRKSFDTVLQRRGWVGGWRILRRASANSRYFAALSSRIPIDVSLGDSAAGVCIDFYGRYQSQAISDGGDPDRVGYVDPPGVSAIDSDPVSMLRGAPDPELAARFIRFCLSIDGQALWQFPAGKSAGDELGPHRFELRRMPIRPDMYQPPYFDRSIDRVKPYELAKPFDDMNRDFWSFIPILFSAMAMDNHRPLSAAWDAIVEHPGYPRDVRGIVVAEDVADPTLRRMLELFDAMPEVRDAADARYSLATAADLGAIRAGWLQGGWTDSARWHPAASRDDLMRVAFTRFFRKNYQEIVRLARAE